MAGTLYLIGTPIGNLEDMSMRAVRILKEVSLIAAEDTRTSRRLLDEYGIATPLTSYHKFNEEEKGEILLSRLLGGEDVALITDAGMPAVSDPGEIIVKKCHEFHVTVTAVPGPSACITALALSGQDTRRFVFEGFLPQDNREQKKVLKSIEDETRTMIFYEAPHRLKRTLAVLSTVLGNDRSLTLCRELTKRFEEIFRTTFADAIDLYGEVDPRGEYVLVIAGKDPKVLKEEKAAEWTEMEIPEHVAYYEARGLNRKAAMKAAAEDRGVSRRDIYRALLGQE